ncbi:MAG: hypothetical protein A2Z14_16920 [Chloroflexi bacterium RBG_16_48_8]|nr:MAG: hypothetical protein A2Z14_16920 [Chloroflexi bacterium RBG_16_48_8]
MFLIDKNITTEDNKPAELTTNIPGSIHPTFSASLICSLIYWFQPSYQLQIQHSTIDTKFELALGQYANHG